MFFNNSIRRGVMGVLNKRIADAQAEHDEVCAFADEECIKDKQEADAKALRVKESSEQAQINKVLGKLI